MYVVTGANGTLGPLVVDQLLARVPASEIAISVRDPAKARAFADRGVRVRRGDFDAPDTLAEAFAGATQVLVISASAIGDLAVRRHRAAFAAAKAAGAQRIVYTSHMGVSPTSPFAPMPAHAASEALLAEGDLPWVSLRNGFYAASALMQMAQALKTGELAAPADGPVSWTTHADLAEAAAIVLTEPHRFSGPTPPLTARGAHDLGDLCRIASELRGRPFTRTMIDDDTFRQRLAGLPAERVDMMVGLFAAMRAGEFAATHPALGELLGREPQSMRDVLAGVPA